MRVFAGLFAIACINVSFLHGTPPAVIGMGRTIGGYKDVIETSDNGAKVLVQTFGAQQSVDIWSCGHITPLGLGAGRALSGDGNRAIVQQGNGWYVRGGPPLITQPSSGFQWAALSYDGTVLWAFLQGTASSPARAIRFDTNQPAADVEQLYFPDGWTSASVEQGSGSGTGIGCVGNASGPGHDTTAFCIRQSGSLGFLPPMFGMPTYARAVSANGRFIAGDFNGEVNGSYRWSQETGMEYLATPLGAASVVKGVSDSGVVIGRVGLTAAIWDEQGHFHELRDWLDARGVDVRRYLFDYGLRISADGRVIVSLGYGDAGREAFVIRLDGSSCPGDVGSSGGVHNADCQLNNDDFIVFIDGFFGEEPFADCGGAGGLPEPDGVFDNNDFIVFIDQFFSGCP